MKPFTYHAPTTVAEAVEMLDKYQSSCAVVAGGTDVVIELNERHKTPEHVISISKLDELRYVKEEDGMVKIGALTTFNDLELALSTRTLSATGTWKEYPFLCKRTEQRASLSDRDFLLTIDGDVHIATW